MQKKKEESYTKTKMNMYDFISFLYFFVSLFRGNIAHYVTENVKKGMIIQNKNGFEAIPDKYWTLSNVTDAIRGAGVESSKLIIGIDYTRSNEWTGAKSFNGFCMHYVDPEGQVLNPYQQVIGIIGDTLLPFDNDQNIQAYGFGDATTTNETVFPLISRFNGTGAQQVLEAYAQITPGLKLLGPTSFAPVIHETIKVVKSKKMAYHILLIICDGDITDVEDTTEAIVEASNYPISIVTIGVGDGPFDLMETYDDDLPERKFDNFQFVHFNEIMSDRENPVVKFAVAALQEVPDQYLAIKELGLMKTKTTRRKK